MASLAARLIEMSERLIKNFSVCFFSFFVRCLLAQRV